MSSWGNRLSDLKESRFLAVNEIAKTFLKGKLRKPTGVLVLCGLMFLNFGIYQFIQDFLAIRNSETETPIIIAALLISLDILCAASAVWAFFGENAGRLSLLAFVSLNMLWSLFVFVLLIANARPKANGYHDSNIFLFGFSLLKPLFLFAVCWWYFTRREVIAYFKQDNDYGFF